MLEDPLKKAVGPRSATALAKLGLHTVADLLRHYPRRYAEPGTLTDLATLAPGEHATVVAEVRQVTVRPTSTGKGLLQAVVTDGQHTLALTFFGRSTRSLGYHEMRLVPGRRGLFTGDVGEYRGQRQFTHPDYTIFGLDVDDEDEALDEAGRPIPLYPASASITSWQIAKAVRTVLDPLTAADLPDPLPEEIRARHGLRTWHETLLDVHVPHTDEDWRRGRDRLRFEEAFVLQAELARRRAAAAAQQATARERTPGGVLEAFDARLPFTLTAGQREVGEQLAAELALATPMQRLLQGEVGSGKTVVALRAMLQVVDAGGQAALLAPTEVLAAQHARSLRAMLGDLADAGYLGGAEVGTRIALLTGSQPAAARRANLLDAASGRAGIVVGTHALLSDVVQFADLGLVVVDEQHRFGVEQRDTLRAKAAGAPHLLVMTATPIPRTVAMTVFGDLETSVLRELPAGRSGVTTHVVPASNPVWTARTWARVREEVDGGGRAYVVCARIDGDGDGNAVDEGPAADGPDDLAAPPPGAPPRAPLRAVVEVAAELAGMDVLRGVRIGTLHGRMAPEEKESALADFASGRVPVLVSTTVVEVGVDVPEATTMVVLDADRFGVSQLHQLRGRVGRGSAPGLCLLVADVMPETPAAVRLETLARTSDGFELAAVDLELRREGDVLGAAQSGASTSLRFLRVTRDADVIERARADARALVERDPTLQASPALVAAIEERLVGEREEFLDRS
ncbi:ATP-dependent DNA helicase RecG [Cellulomonas soli]|uniref:ATP-dependent DNA helicase RecG n=1 Tax=Cellulomonas soli TaxID=931535 RepID=UPI003F87AFE0